MVQSQWRVACVRIPRFAIGALWRAAGVGEGARQLALPLGSEAGVADAGPHWDERPLGVIEGQRLRAVTAAAGRRRVRAGMTLAEARASCAELEPLAWDARVVEQAITQATAAFVLASPQVTPAASAPGVWWIGAGGLDGVGGERGLVRTLWRVATLWHPQPRIAVADSCVAARAATWAGEPEAGVTVVRGKLGGPAGRDDAIIGIIVPRGGCAAWLARAPLALLPLDDELRTTLVALGLRTAGAFAALDPGEVERRWGAEGLLAWRLARGDDPRRPVLAQLEASREVAAELATPADSLEPVLFLVRAALERLTSTLAAEGRAVAALAITLTLDDHPTRDHRESYGARAYDDALPSPARLHTITREVRLPRPIARTAPLFERCRALLERFTLHAPVVGVRTSVTATASAHGAQGDLLDARWRDPSAAEAAFDRLRAELGPDVVVRAMAGDAYRPEHEGRWKDEEPGLGTRNSGQDVEGRGRERASSRQQGSERPVPGPQSPVPDFAALRLLEAPEAIEVECSADGAPRALAWRGRRITVLRAVGPERLSGDWWRDGYRRDYWRCAPEGGAVAGELLLYQDPRGAWHLQGWYD